MNAIFDSIIYGFLFVDGVLIVRAILRIRRHRHLILVPFFIFAWLVIFYGSFIEPRLIIMREQIIVLNESKDDANSMETLRAVLISDFHLGPYKKESFVEKVVAKITELAPEVVFIAGDFVYDSTDQIQYLDPLKNLKTPLGVFAVLGNHDYGEEIPPLRSSSAQARAKLVRETLESLGVQVLVNETHVLPKGGKRMLLIGTDDVWTGRADIIEVAGAKVAPFGRSNEVASLRLGLFDAKIVLSHNPDIIRQAEKHGVDLVLAGHTHGGQIRLPGIGPVPDIPDELGRDYDRGYFLYGRKTPLFITSGLGEMGPRARLLTPPEIVLLNIKF